jgi:tRNA(adenine34) deaminase
MTDEQWMDVALGEAEDAFRRGDWPVAAVLVKDGRAIASGQNRQNSATDLSCHAEIEALRAAFLRSAASTCRGRCSTARWSPARCAHGR